ncbi:hypothetical protein AJ80_06219 [Polytolypa hystricis UAMH7299]|uniref:RNA helicase n=1 Tax=Polytolypa hystricis (strain UAMH7299) TaxID=1447883 RepID=A0A2B7XPJ5_POLH7|nr:hypothetical protein AJ80_06219 [Polytolypa hystricis UAMH7299]
MQRFQPIQHRCLFPPVSRQVARGWRPYSSCHAPACQLQSPKDGRTAHRHATLTNELRRLITRDHKRVNGISKGITRYSTSAEAAIRVNEDITPPEAFRNNTAAPFPQASELKEVEDMAASSYQAHQIDIYNYAARFGAVPTMKLEKTPSGIKFTYELAEQGIKVEEVGTNFKSARKKAVQTFKRMAANYCSGNAETISIMTSTALTTKNASQFLKYHKVINGKAEVVITAEAVDKKEYNKDLFVANVNFFDEVLSGLVYDITATEAVNSAELVAATLLRRRQPEFWTKYLQELKRGSGRIVWPVKKPSSLDLDDATLFSMRNTLRKVKANNLYDEREQPDYSPTTEVQEFRRMIFPRLSRHSTASISHELKKQRQQLQTNPALSDLRQKVEALPANQLRQEISTMINDNVYSIVVGATGSGKTTQVPQILFDNAIRSGNGALCNVMITQPRRMAATSVANRVAVERNVPLGDTVGYHVRFNRKLPRFTGSISFCTVGILLAYLRHTPDELFDTVSHLVIDEVHERDLDLDFLLISLKTAIKERQLAGKKVPHVVFMSATANTNLFANYFKIMSPDGEPTPCPQINIPGRTYPVRELFLEHVLETLSKSNYDPDALALLFQERVTAKYLKNEEAYVSNEVEGSKGESLSPSIDWVNIHNPNIETDKDSLSQVLEDAPVPVGLAAATIAHITKTTNEGAILVFLPGFDSIKKLEEILLTQLPLHVDFADERKFKVFKLHSSIAAGQTEVFEPVPKGCRKIILSTNIAETSITIPEIRYIVDTGKVNQLVYDQRRRIRKLACCWISQSNAKQRAGRAGRVQHGTYYALYTKRRHASLPAIATSEMLRLDLQEVCLNVKATGPDRNIRDFLGQAIEPPLPEFVDTSVLQLQALETLDEKENITALGRLLARLPIHPTLGKMIVLGIIFRCLGPMIIAGAAVGDKDLFLYPPLEHRTRIREIRRNFAGSSGSDHIAIINAYNEMRTLLIERGQHAAFEFAIANFISFPSFRYMTGAAKQIEEILWKEGLIPVPETNSAVTGKFGGPELNTNSSEESLIKAILLSGVFPNLAVKNDGRLNAWQTESEGLTMIGSKSVNFAPMKPEPFPMGSLAAFTSMTKARESNTIYINENSLVSPLMVCLFGGRLRSQQRTIRMDSWLPMRIRAGKSVGEDIAATRTVFEFRKALDRMLSYTFQDLAKYTESSGLRREDDDGGRDVEVQRRYLADDPVREAFASGLVDVLSTT